MAVEFPPHVDPRWRGSVIGRVVGRVVGAVKRVLGYVLGFNGVDQSMSFVFAPAGGAFGVRCECTCNALSEQVLVSGLDVRVGIDAGGVLALRYRGDDDLEYALIFSDLVVQAGELMLLEWLIDGAQVVAALGGVNQALVLPQPIKSVQFNELGRNVSGLGGALFWAGLFKRLWLLDDAAPQGIDRVFNFTVKGGGAQGEVIEAPAHSDGPELVNLDGFSVVASDDGS